MNRTYLLSNKPIYLFSILLAFTLLSGLMSCKTKKLAQGPTSATEELSPEEITAKFLARPSLSFFSGKAKIKIKSKYGSEKGVLYTRISRDSVIWAAVKKLSVEGGRALITKDSAFLINRLDKSYLAEPLSMLEKSYGLAADYTYVEDLFLGLTPTVDTTAYWELTEDTAYYKIKTMAQNRLHLFHLDKRDGTVTSGSYHDKFISDGTWEYDDYRVVSEGIELPFYRKYELTMGNDEYLSLEIKYSEIELNIPKDIKFSIPSHYTKIN